MARVHHRKAAKDYPQFGIAKGEMYYYVKIKTGPRTSREMRSKTPFKRSALTQSDYLAQLYDWEDSKAEISDMDSAQQFADDIRALGEEQDEKFNNMPEGLQQGDSGQMLEERRDACEQAASDIEEIISEWESAKDEWESEIEEYRTEKKFFDEETAAHDEWDDLDEEEQEGRDEPEVRDEPDLPDHTRDNGDDVYEFDEDEWLDRVREVSVG